jgi:hypothetical protein
MSTPIYTKRPYSYFDFTTSINDMGETICTSEYKNDTDRSGDGLSDLNLGLTADMEYWIKRWGGQLALRSVLPIFFRRSTSKIILAIQTMPSPFLLI